MNKVQLTGFCMSDPEISTTPQGKKCARIKIISQISYRNVNGNKISETQFYHVIAWSNIADIIELSFKKGIEVIVEGRLVLVTPAENTFIQATKVYPLSAQLLY